MTMIKWIRLSEISEKITGKKVDISLTTMIGTITVGKEPLTVISYVSADDQSVKILLNASECKSIENVITAISHELAHVIIKTNEHPVEHDKEWKKIENQITKLYKEEA